MIDSLMLDGEKDTPGFLSDFKMSNSMTFVKPWLPSRFAAFCLLNLKSYKKDDKYIES